MGVWKRIFNPAQKTDVEVLRGAVKDSFSRVAQDVAQLKTWVIHLHQAQGSLQTDHHLHKNLREQEGLLFAQKITSIEQEQKMLAKYFSDLIDYLQKKGAVEAKFASELDKFRSELELLKSRRETSSEKKSIEGSVSSVHPSSELKFEPSPNYTPTAPTNKIESIKKGSQNALEEKILQRFRVHRKEFIVQKIIEILDSQLIGTKELEQIVVDEKGLCGRTSFFAYLKELRLKNIVEDAWTGNRKILSIKHKITKKTEI